MPHTVLCLEDVENRENLAVVRHQRLANERRGDHKLLQHFQRRDDDVGFSRVEGSYRRVRGASCFDYEAYS